VTFLGRVSPKRIPELYREHDVYCQTSLVEPQGQALLEALATARPVVATRVGGPPEYVTEGAGVLVDPLDVADIAAGMRAAAALPVPCDAARAVAEAHSIAVSAARIERVLGEVS
jgi:glycosyltransferase involved in cell wall biosynthesis